MYFEQFWIVVLPLLEVGVDRSRLTSTIIVGFVVLLWWRLPAIKRNIIFIFGFIIISPPLVATIFAGSFSKIIAARFQRHLNHLDRFLQYPLEMCCSKLSNEPTTVKLRLLVALTILNWKNYISSNHHPDIDQNGWGNVEKDLPWASNTSFW